MLGTTPPKAQPAPQANLSYQTGMTLHDPIGAGQRGSLLSGLMRPTGAANQGGTAGQAAAQMGRGIGMNNAMNAQHQIAQVNADQNMEQQARRSDASLSGLNQQMEGYQNALDRQNQEGNLATEIYGRNLGFASGLAAMQIRAMQQSMQGMREQMQQALAQQGSAQ